MDAAEIIARLKFLKNVKAGDKICTENCKIQPPGWYQGIERYMLGENKMMTLDFLKKVFNNAFQLQASYKSGHVCSPLASRFTKISLPKQEEIASLLLKDIHEATIGVGFLQETYKHDIKFKCDLTTLCENVMIRLKLVPDFVQSITSTPPPSPNVGRQKAPRPSEAAEEEKNVRPLLSKRADGVRKPLRKPEAEAEAGGRLKRKKNSTKNER
jgi:hypothetical protein